jgi:hypothetical protein
MQAACGPGAFFSGAVAREADGQMLYARLHGRYLGDALGQGRLAIRLCMHAHGHGTTHACKTQHRFASFIGTRPVKAEDWTRSIEVLRGFLLSRPTVRRR